MTIKWHQALDTNLNWLDEDHRELLNHINELCQVLPTMEPAEVLDKLTHFENDLKNHFEKEERVMENSQCHRFEQHKKQHDQFLGKFKNIKKELVEKVELQYVDEMIMQKIGTWLVNHILKSDKKIQDNRNYENS